MFPPTVLELPARGDLSLLPVLIGEVVYAVDGWLVVDGGVGSVVVVVVKVVSEGLASLGFGPVGGGV